MVRQPVRHSSWHHLRQTVRPRRLMAARQQPDAAEREAQSLPRVHQPKGQLNNALPKAKRRPPAKLDEAFTAREAAIEQDAIVDGDARYAAAVQAARREPDQQRDANTQGFTSLVATASEPDQTAAAQSGRRAASGTVLGAIALITGGQPVSQRIDVQQRNIVGGPLTAAPSSFTVKPPRNPAGSTVGAGILALPTVTAPAGFVPSGATMIAVWALLAAEALLLAESNLAIRAQQVLLVAAPAHYTTHFIRCPACQLPSMPGI